MFSAINVPLPMKMQVTKAIFCNMGFLSVKLDHFFACNGGNPSLASVYFSQRVIIF